MTKVCPPRRAIIEAALISAAKCAEAEGKRQTWSDLASAVDRELAALEAARIPDPEAAKLSSRSQPLSRISG
jgi:hypothetical protein